MIAFSGNKLTQFCSFNKAASDFWNEAEGLDGAKFSWDIDAAGRARISDTEYVPRLSGNHEGYFSTNIRCFSGLSVMILLLITIRVDYASFVQFVAEQVWVGALITHAFSFHIFHDNSACRRSISRPFLTEAPCCRPFWRNKVIAGL